jgi:hypothetical protein
MDKRIEKLKTPEQCAIFARNAAERNRPDLAEQARKRAVQLSADSLGAESEAEKEALQAVFAYEEVLTKKNGKKTRASRTWQMINRHGILKAVERAVNRNAETQGYTALVEMGLEEFAFEAVILRHPDLFSKEAILRSRARLSEWRKADDPDPSSRNDDPVFTTIQNAKRIAKAQAVFEKRVQETASKSGQITFGHQGGGKESKVHFIGSLNFWIACAESDSGNRYWNALGTGDPFKEDSTIIAEINPPKTGVNRRVSGAFIEDSAGKTYLAHRGRVGGGRKGIGKKAFMAWYPEAIDLVNDEGQRNEMIVIGALDDENLIENLAAFTNSVSTFKDEAVSEIPRQRFTMPTQTPNPAKSPPLVSVATANAKNRRIMHLARFYSILDQLERKIGGSRKLADCSDYLDWPSRGVYFFMEDSEVRSDTGNSLRIVRVGTHALKADANTTLWTCLSQHRGVTSTGGGNHRGSIFRLIVGTALSAKSSHDFPSWSKGSTASAEVRAGEINLECMVSHVIGQMPFIWVPIEDEPGPNSERGHIERNSISLLSNFSKLPLDPPSKKWLGLFCNRERVRKSGLWNSNHVDEPYDPAFLDRLEQLVAEMGPTS